MRKRRPDQITYISGEDSEWKPQNKKSKKSSDVVVPLKESLAFIKKDKLGKSAENKWIAIIDKYKFSPQDTLQPIFKEKKIKKGQSLNQRLLRAKLVPAKNLRGLNLLMLAAGYNWPSVTEKILKELNPVFLKFFLQQPVSYEDSKYHGITAPMIAAASGNKDVLVIMLRLDPRAAINADCTEDARYDVSTPLMCAIHCLPSKGSTDLLIRHNFKTCISMLIDNSDRNELEKKNTCQGEYFGKDALDLAKEEPEIRELILRRLSSLPKVQATSTHSESSFSLASSPGFWSQRVPMGPPLLQENLLASGPKQGSSPQDEKYSGMFLPFNENVFSQDNAVPSLASQSSEEFGVFPAYPVAFTTPNGGLIIKVGITPIGLPSDCNPVFYSIGSEEFIYIAKLPAVAEVKGIAGCHMAGQDINELLGSIESSGSEFISGFPPVPTDFPLPDFLKNLWAQKQVEIQASGTFSNSSGVAMLGKSTQPSATNNDLESVPMVRKSSDSQSISMDLAS